ncbi:MAG: beta-propeller domain-containing protein, partial [bacterium]
VPAYGAMGMYGYGYAMLSPSAFGLDMFVGASAYSGTGALYGGVAAGGYGLYSGYSSYLGGTAGYALSSSGLGWGGYAPIGGYSSAVRYRTAASGADIRLNGDGDLSAPFTNIGADEADIVKSDDTYIYMIKGEGVRIIRVYPPEDLAELPGIEFPGTDFTPKKLYVEGNIMAVIGEEERGSETIQFVDGQAYLSPIYLRPTFTRVFLYDITDRAQVIRTRSLRFEAQYKQSRGTDGTLYLIMHEDPPYELLDEDLPDARAVLPVYSDSSVHGEGGGSVEVDTVCGCEDVAYFPRYAQPRYLLVVGIPLQDFGQAIDAEVILGDCDYVLSSAEGLYVASTDVEGDAPVTLVYRFDYTDQGILVAGSAKVAGEVIDSSGMHGHDGRFMISTNSAMAPLQSDLYVFNDLMRLTGILSGLAPGETMESVRFFEDRCYMVTGSEGYPFLVISLDDPMDPWVAEELDILGGSEYLHLYDAGHILGFGRDIQETAGPGLRIALYDITDTAAPILVGEEEIGGSKTGSALFTDHRALLVNPAEHLMAFPVTKTEDVEGMPYPYQYTFQGAYVFDINGNGLSRMAEITHHPSGTFPRPSYAPTGDHIARVLCIGDTYCTVSENLIRVFDIQGHTETGMLVVD